MKLNSREVDVLNILSQSEKPLTSTQIVDHGNDLTQSTVQAVLRKLLANGLVEVGGVTYSGNVLSRTFCLTEKSKEIVSEILVSEFESLSCIVDRPAVVVGLFRSEDDISKRKEDIEKIEKFIEELKKDLE